MRTSIIELSKIIFCPTSKKYQIFFTASKHNKYFVINLSNAYAKNIAMASENIASASLSQYELIINLLNQLNIVIYKICIKKRNNFLTSFVYFRNNDKKFEINSNITDAIILSMKTFTDLSIDSDLLIDENHNQEGIDKKSIHTVQSNSKIESNYIDNSSNIDVLKLALDKCIQDEKFESAAFLRDRIESFKK